MDSDHTLQIAEDQSELDDSEFIMVTDVSLEDKKAIAAFLKSPDDNTAIQVANTNAIKFKNLLNKVFYPPYDRVVAKGAKWSLEVEANDNLYYVDTDMRKTFGIVGNSKPPSIKITWFRI